MIQSVFCESSSSIRNNTSRYFGNGIYFSFKYNTWLAYNSFNKVRVPAPEGRVHRTVTRIITAISQFKPRCYRPRKVLPENHGWIALSYVDCSLITVDAQIATSSSKCLSRWKKKYCRRLHFAAGERRQLWVFFVYYRGLWRSWSRVLWRLSTNDYFGIVSNGNQADRLYPPAIGWPQRWMITVDVDALSWIIGISWARERNVTWHYSVYWLAGGPSLTARDSSRAI